MNNYDFILADTLAKFKATVKKHDKIRVAYSGGADSDCMMKLATLAGLSITAVFYDTGIEYEATERHIEYMRGQGYTIDTTRAAMPIPTSNRKYGTPLVNKRASDYIGRLQSHDFDFQNHGAYDFNTLYKMYPNCKTALMWWCNGYEGKSQWNIKNNPHLKEFIIANGINFAVANKCCDGAKKYPMRDYAKTNDLDLVVLGIRKAEGGGRVGAYKSCYTKVKADSYHVYMPLFWWDENMRAWFIKSQNIQLSDAYTVYGLKRTGCAGCPFGRDFLGEMRTVERFEPKLAKGIHAIFKDAHEFTTAYKQFQAAQRVPENQPRLPFGGGHEATE